MTNKKRYISNSKSPMDTKPDKVVGYDMHQHSTNHITLSKNFFYLRIVPLILHRAPISLFSLVRENEAPILTFLNLYVTLSGIHYSTYYLNFVSLPLSCKFSFFLLDFDLPEKRSLR